MDTPGTLQRPPRWRFWIRVVACTLGGLVAAAVGAVVLYGLFLFAYFIVMLVIANFYLSNK